MARPSTSISLRRRRPTGAALVFVLALVLVLAAAGVLLVRLAGDDRRAAGKLGLEDRGQACAEAGLQYARRFFGTNYTTSNNWNDYLDGTKPLYRYDLHCAPDCPQNDSYPTNFADLPLQVRGASNGTTLDPGSDLDGDGRPDFWVSIRDDVDEAPLGLPEKPTHDNNGMVIIRSECTNPAWARQQGGQPANVVLEATITYGNQAAMGSNYGGVNPGSRGNNL